MNNRCKWFEKCYKRFASCLENDDELNFTDDEKRELAEILEKARKMFGTKKEKELPESLENRLNNITDRLEKLEEKVYSLEKLEEKVYSLEKSGDTEMSDLCRLNDELEELEEKVYSLEKSGNIEKLDLRHVNDGLDEVINSVLSIKRSLVE